MSMSRVFAGIQIGMALAASFEAAAADGVLTADEGIGLMQEAIATWSKVTGQPLQIRIGAAPVEVASRGD